MVAIFRQAAYIAILAPLARANIDTGVSFVIGDEAPWGLPDSSFRPSSQANATGSSSIPAANTSNPKEPLEFDGKFWTIGISLQANIPLNGSTDKNLNAAEKNQFTQLVSMSLDNIDKGQAANLTVETTMCGHIMFGVKPNVTADNQDDAGKGGNCDFLSQQCQKDLQNAAIDGANECDSIAVPNSCAEWLGPSSSENEGSQMSSTYVQEFTKNLLLGSRFFTIGLEPTSNNNETEYDTAIRNIWPVLFTFSHVSSTANVSNAALRCLRPNNITNGSRDPDASNNGGNGDGGSGDHPGTAGTYSVPNLGATLLLAVSASYFMFL
ncbi:hypothetical protein ACQKWADRAFT_307463 [Trichoderma austrokoningii]